jgi:hypothetical protein
MLRIATVALLAFGASASTPNAWDEWHMALARQCPLNHVEWNAGRGYDELIDAYVTSLAPAARQRLVQAADYKANCGKVSLGFTCEMDAYLNAAQRLGMLQDMAAVSCQKFRCEEPGLCTRPPHSG